MAANTINDKSEHYDVKITTLNTHGLKSNIPYISDMLMSNDIIFISEHWLSNAEKPVIKELISQNQKLHFNPAEKKGTGRPYGGTCFIVNKEKVGNTTVVHEDQHILAIKSTVNDTPQIYVGLYLTCFHGNSSINDYQDELDTLSSLIKLHQEDCEIIMMGDLQTFPAELYDNSPRNNSKRNSLSKPLQVFLREHALDLVDVTNGTGPIITYQHKTLPHSSYIDHIIMSKNNPLWYQDCCVHSTDPLNMSDHNAVSIIIQLQQPSMAQIMENESTNDPTIPSFAWKQGDFIIEYSKNVEERLSSLQTDGQTVGVDVMCAVLHESAKSAFDKCYPERTRSPHAKPWWTEELSQLKQSLSLHFNNWRDAHFPRDIDNVIFNRFCMARKNFRQAVKKAQNKKIYESLNKMNALRNTNSTKFWSKIRQMRKSNSKRVFNINNKNKSEEITGEFADNFNSLLNNPVIKCESNPRPIPPPEVSPNRIHLSTDDIKKCIDKLKENKAQDPAFMVSEHIIYATSESMLSWLLSFYTNIFDEQDCPENMSKSTIHPLVKSYKKSLRSFNNYRGISIIPVFTKLLEYIILRCCPEIAESHPLQNGYKFDSSTLHAEFLIKETLHHYNKNGSPVYVCGLDAEKAFDSCNWEVLFEKLYYKKNIPLSIVNVIKSLYVKGSSRVKYDGHLSYEFSLSQGVRQGSVLSPHLYNIYTEELLRCIEDNAIDGTTLHGQFTGILMYADDIILMSTTLNGLRKLIDTVTTVSKENCINFNADKTEFCISKQNDCFENTFTMNGYTISPTNSLKHLGVLWNLKRGILTMEDENIQLRISKFWSVIKALIKEGIRFCHPHTIKHLYNTIAVPTLTYGIELCDLTPGLANKLDTEGRKAIKQLFNLSIYSKNFLNSLLNIENISTRIIRNKINLFTRLLRGETTAVPLMKMLETPALPGTFVADIRNVAQAHDIDLLQILVSRECPPINIELPELPEDLHNRLLSFLNNWSDAESRRIFREIMEERIVR